MRLMNRHEAYPGLSERILAALRFDGMVSPDAQELHLADVTGVQIRTARGWLRGSTKPRSSTFNRIWKGLNVDFEWLAVGEFRLGPNKPDRHALIAGMPDWQIRVTHGMHKMTTWEKDKFFRYVFRLANRDRKALRLSEMCERGQISRRQLFEAM